MAGCLPFKTNCIDRERIEKAFEKILSLNPYLYNRYIRVSEDEVPTLKNYDDPTRLIRQYPEKDQKIKLDYIEMSDAELDVFLHQATPPYDLFHAPMIRATLIRTPTHDALVYDMFHGLMDGISIQQFVMDMATLYQGDEIVPQGMRFYEIAESQYEAFNSERYLADKEFYENKLRNITHYTDFYHQNGDRIGGNSLHLQKIIPSTQINAWAEKNHCTAAAFLMAAYAKALSVMTGEQKVIFSTYHHGRSAEELKNSIYGQFTIPLIVVLDIDQNEDIKDLINKVKRNLVEDIRHHSCPIYHIRKDLRTNNCYGTEFLYNGHHMDFELVYEGNRATWTWLDFGLSTSHLEFYIFQDGSLYILDTMCSDSLYSSAQAKEFMNIYYNIVTGIVHE